MKCRIGSLWVEQSTSSYGKCIRKSMWLSGTLRHKAEGGRRSERYTREMQKAKMIGYKEIRETL